MRAILISVIRSLVAVVLFVSAVNAQSITGPLSGADNPRYVSASYAHLYARYYTPYAIQAAAAYVDVARFNATRGPSGEPPRDGSDVALAVREAGVPPEMVDRATKYFRGWQYQFGSEGYLRCFDLDPDCQKAIRADRWTFAASGGPAFHVWARTRYPRTEGAGCSEVSIAFRGTTGSVADWFSNADPFSHYVYDDYYRQLRRNIGPIIKRIATLDCYKRAERRPQIVSVGHGGLAQMAALANPVRPRIAKVFAFDPSPVTGAPLVDSRILSQNAKRLEIDRIYQSGEAVSYLRGTHEQFPESSNRCKPFVRTVVFDVFQRAGPIVLHNMPGLSRELVRLASSEYNAPPGAPDCPTRYRPPTTDEYELPGRGPGGVARAPGGAGVALAQANRGRLTDAYAQSNWFGAALGPTKMGGPAPKRARTAGAHEGKRIAKRQIPAMRLGINAAPLRG
jgi:hypothetical protein